MDCIYAFVYGWAFRLLHILAVVNDAIMNIGLRISFRINVFNFFEMNSLSFYLMVYLGLFPQVDQVALCYLFLFKQY